MSEPNLNQAHQFKTVLLGESAVGKTSIMHYFIRGTFDPFRESTIGAGFFSKNVTSTDGISIRFDIWDTAGQERYKSLTPMYYRNASCAIVVYDTTITESFGRAITWVKELKNRGEPNIIIVLVGNKIDLQQRRTVLKTEGQNYALKEGLMFYETSAFKGININEMFQDLADKLAEIVKSRESSGKAGKAQPRILLDSNNSVLNETCAC